MKSVRNMFKIGVGPSSSHTMGPVYAAKRFLCDYPDMDRAEVILYGSLAKTGRGHGTDRALLETLAPIPATIEFHSEEIQSEHPNTMDLIAYRGDKEMGRMRVLSIGGGEIRVPGEASDPETDLYAEQNFSQIAEICKSRNIRLSDYVFEHEDKDFRAYLSQVWQTMSAAIREGLTHTGTCPVDLAWSARRNICSISGTSMKVLRPEKTASFAPMPLPSASKTPIAERS